MPDLEGELDLLLSESIEAAREREAVAFDRIAEGRQIVLFGAGNLGRMTLRGLRKAGVEPLAFSDNDASKWDKTIDGLKVLPPQEAAHQHGSSAVFVVCIWNALGTHRYVKSYAQLAGLGCTRISPFMVAYWKYSETLLPYLLFDLPHKVLEARVQVRSVLRLWHDEASRIEYYAQIRWRLLADFSVLPEPLHCPDYLPPGIFSFLEEEVFVDCGAYVGDSIENLFIKPGRSFAAVHALEPDPRTFAKLNAYVNGLPDGIRRKINTQDLAASSRWHEATFQADGSEAASLSAGGNIRVRCGPLDQALGGSTPTFIKMDIEGAEQDALRGATGLIQRCQPLLAICVYHKQADIWEIPALIDSMKPGYRFFLRPHLPEGMQSVCYAVPETRLC